MSDDRLSAYVLYLVLVRLRSGQGPIALLPRYIAVF